MDFMASEEIHLRDYLVVLRKWRWFIITILLTVVILVTMLTFRQVPVYQATTRLLIEKEAQNVLSFEEVLELDTSKEDYYETQYKILKSRALAKRVLTKLDMMEQNLADNETEAEHLIVLNRIKAYILKQLGVEQPSVTEADQGILKEEHRIENFLKMITISPIQGSRLVDINVKSTNRNQAVRIANTLAELYIEQNLESKLAASKDAVQWLQKELEITQQKITHSESELYTYKKQHEVISFAERQSIAMQKLSELTSAVNKMRIQRATAEALYQNTKTYSTDEIDSIPQILHNDLIQQLKLEIADLETQYSEALKTFRRKHPTVMTLESQIESAQKRLKTEMERVITSIKNEYDVLLAQERSLTKMLEQQRHEILDLSEKAAQLTGLENEVESNRKIYNALLQRLKETDVTERLQTNNIRIVDRATLPQSPIAPRKKRNILLSMVIGLMLGMTGAFFFEYLDNHIRTSDDIKYSLDIPFLGMIPKVDSKNGFLHGRKSLADRIVAADPTSNVAEAFRSVRTNISFSFLHDDFSLLDEGTVLLVTSPGPGEGKSCVVANLGIALAQSGHKTLIIDCDLRKPVIHTIFNLDKKKGLVDFMMNAKNNGYKLSIQHTDIEHLDVLPCGTIPPNPAELLGSHFTKIIFEALSERYKHIILDSPPLNAVSDPLILSQMTDGIVLVVRAGHTTRGAAQHARELLQKTDVPILGGVLNSVDLKKDMYYYYSHYHYNYSYKHQS